MIYIGIKLHNKDNVIESLTNIIDNSRISEQAGYIIINRNKRGYGAVHIENEHGSMIKLTVDDKNYAYITGDVLDYFYLFNGIGSKYGVDSGKLGSCINKIQITGSTVIIPDSEIKVIFDDLKRNGSTSMLMLDKVKIIIYNEESKKVNSYLTDVFELGLLDLMFDLIGYERELLDQYIEFVEKWSTNKDTNKSTK